MPVIVTPVHPSWAGSSSLSPPFLSTQPLPESLARDGPGKRQTQPFARHRDTGLRGGHIHLRLWNRRCQMGASETPAGLGVRFLWARGPSWVSSEKSSTLGTLG